MDMKQKLSTNQLHVIETLLKYNCAVMLHSGYVTGGHGVKLNMNSVRSLQRIGIVDNNGKIAGKWKESANELFNEEVNSITS